VKIQLQKFFHKNSSYARPNQPWVCGKHAQGYNCEAGPDMQGCCRTEYECKPYKENNSWICSRSNNYGGSCDEGPMPNGECCNKITQCQPTRSIRQKRSLVVKWSVFAIFAMMMLLLNSHTKATFFSPGDLSFKHGKIDQCSTCHEVFDKSFFNWVKQALSGENTIDNSKKCLDCHKFGENAHQPHGLARDDLQQLKKNKKETNNREDKQLACLSCHLEHHGADSDLTDVAKQNCAYCHRLDQSVINAQHPEFNHYPYKRNTRIIFDHTTHAKKYYYNKAGDQLLDTAPESCQSCHQSDSRANKMMQHAYAKDCKACHKDIFEESESFIVFEIPELAFDATELNVQWPEGASGTLTHFMIMLLATDSLFVEAVADLDDYFDLSELDKQKTKKIVKSIKKLFFEIDQQGPIVFKKRLVSAFNCQLNEQGQFDSDSLCTVKKAELDLMVKLFPLKLFCEAKQRWFPSLSRTFVNTQNSNNFCADNRHNHKIPTEAGEWVLEELSIEYRPDKHKDAFIKSWLDLTSQQLDQILPEKARLEIFKELNSEDASVQCTKCHSVESTDGKNFRVNWPPKLNKIAKKQFIKFNHNAHIKYQDEKVCLDCHLENLNTAYLDSYEDLDPLTFESNFTTERNNCSSCHQQSMTKEQCQLCHNYHVSP